MAGRFSVVCALSVLACSGRTISDPPIFGGGAGNGGPAGSGEFSGTNPAGGGGGGAGAIGGVPPAGGAGVAGVGAIGGVAGGGAGGSIVGGSSGIGGDPGTGGVQIMCGTGTGNPDGTVMAAPNVTLAPVPSDLAACTLTNCQGAHCTTNVGSNVAGLFAQCADSSSCVPDGFIGTNYQFELHPCQTFENFEGRCLSTCMPEVAGQLSTLPQSYCDCTERCAPCYLPWPAPAGQPQTTGVCSLGVGDAPTTSSDANAFVICGKNRGVCVPTSLVPAALAAAAPKDTCNTGYVCAPIEYVQTPNYQFPSCKPSNALFAAAKPNNEGQYGACVPSYLVDDTLPSADLMFIANDHCPDPDDLCGPCNNPYSTPPGQASGICPP